MLAVCTTIVVWLRHVLQKLGIRQETNLNAKDNFGAKNWANGGPATDFARRNQFYVKLNFGMEHAKKEHIALIKVGSNKMMADFLTKPLGTTEFVTAISALELFSLERKTTSDGREGGC